MNLPKQISLIVLMMSFAHIQAQNPADSVVIAPPAVEADTISAFEKNLDDFVVTAKKEVIKSDGSKLTYDLQEDDSSKGQSLLDALRKVPMVAVDGQSNITINGSTNFKIYVNGKEDRMLEANYSQVFKAMPAESVSKIEVITEPGAQYDAEGVGGILNLITEHSQKHDGYSGSLHASYGLSQGVLGGYITGKADKFTISANAAYATNGAWEQKQLSSIDVTYKSEDINHLLETLGKQRIGFNYFGGGIDMGWEPNDRNLFNLGGSINNVNADIKEMSSVNTMYSRSGAKQWNYTENYTGSLINLGANANASYRHSFNDDNTHRIIAAYMFNYGKNNLNALTEISDVDNYFYYSPFRTIDNSEFSREHTIQMDYSNPFGEGKHRLDGGFKGVIRRNSSDSRTLVGKDQIEMVTDSANTMSTLQQFDIYAGYLSYTGTFSKLSVTAGLRYEHTIMGMKVDNMNGFDFTKHLNDVVPNASLTWSFAPANNLRLAYQMRIMRPGISQVNPYSLKLNEYSANRGNPDLTSARSNGVSLTYTNFSRILGGNVQLVYTQIDNAITNYSYLDGQTWVESYINAGHERQLRLGGYLTANLSSTMKLSVNANINYAVLEAPSINASHHGWFGFYGVNWDYTAPYDIKVGAYGGQQIRHILLQGDHKGWYYYGLYVGRDFLKKKLNVTFTASGFLHRYTNWTTTMETADIKTYSVYRNRNTDVALSISWNFGHLKESIKKTGLDISNDDNVSTSNKQGGGSGGGISL